MSSQEQYHYLLRSKTYGCPPRFIEEFPVLFMVGPRWCQIYYTADGSWSHPEPAAIDVKECFHRDNFQFAKLTHAEVLKIKPRFLSRRRFEEKIGRRIFKYLPEPRVATEYHNQPIAAGPAFSALHPEDKDTFNSWVDTSKGWFGIRWLKWFRFRRRKKPTTPLGMVVPADAVAAGERSAPDASPFDDWVDHMEAK